MSNSLFGNTASQQQPATGTSIFGNALSSHQQPTTGSGLFGSTTSQQPSTTGSLFGSTTQPAGTGSSIFGSTTQPATTGSIFGSNTNAGQSTISTPTLFGQPAAQTSTSTTQPSMTGSIFGSGGSTSLFGQPATQTSTNTTTQPAATGSIFGASATPAPSLFGQPAAQASTSATQPSTTGNIFGASTTPAPSLFGQPAAQTSGTTQPSTTGSIFGASTTQAPSLFGQPAAQTSGTTPSTTGNIFGGGTSIFGQPAAQASTTTTQSNGSIFGSGTGTSLFGQPVAQTSTTATQPNGSIFGGSANASLFGQPAAQSSTGTIQPTTSLFGQPAQKPTGPLFGSTQPSTTGTLFGSTLAAPTLGTGLGTGSILGTSTTRPSQSTLGTTAQQQDPQSQFMALMQRIDGIAEAWNPNSTQCRFQHYFYNLVDPASVSQYGRPANATNEALWQRAVRENPDPSCLVPVLAVGFDALNSRVEAQSTQATAQQEKLKELKKRLQALTATHTDTTLSRVHRALSQHTQVSQRILKLVQHLHLLIPAVRSSSIRPEEEALRVALEEMEEDLRKPGGMSKMKSKLNELWALVGAINAARERGKKAGGDGAVEWTVVDEEGLKQITQILSDQQAGLQHLTKILQRDLKDLGVIMGTNGDREDGQPGGDMRLSASPSLLNGSTSTLHASALR